MSYQRTEMYNFGIGIRPPYLLPDTGHSPKAACGPIPVAQAANMTDRFRCITEVRFRLNAVLHQSSGTDWFRPVAVGRPGDEGAWKRSFGMYAATTSQPGPPTRPVAHLRSTSEWSSNIDASVFVLAMQRETGRQIQAQRTEVVLCSRSAGGSRVSLRNTKPLLAKPITRCLQQFASNTAPAVARLDDEADDGSDLLSVGCRLVIERAQKVTRCRVAPADGRAAGASEIALHGTALDALAREHQVLRRRAFGSLDDRVILAKALAVASRPPWVIRKAVPSKNLRKSGSNSTHSFRAIRTMLLAVIGSLKC